MHYPILALIIANIIWGAAVPIFKYSLSNIPPFTLLFIRFFIAGLIFLPFSFSSWKHMSVRDFFELALAAVFGLTFAIALLFLGLQDAPSINHPIISSAGPIVLYFIAITVLKEKKHSKVLYGSLLSLFGVLVIVLSPMLFGEAEASLGVVEGNMLFVASMIAHVIYTLLSRRVLQKYGVYQVTSLMFLIAAATFAPFSFGELSTWSFSELSLPGMVGIIYGTFFSSGIAYWCFHYGISRIAAQEIGIFTYIDPVIALVVAAPLLGEYPTPYYFIGALLVFAGIFIAEGRIHWHPLHRLRK